MSSFELESSFESHDRGVVEITSNLNSQVQYCTVLYTVFCNSSQLV